MRSTLTLGAGVAALALLVAAPSARAADDDVPSFKKRGDKEKKWVEEVGTAIVKAARSKPADVELDTYKITEPKKGRKELKITMNWKGYITKKKFTSTILVKIDVNDKDVWEVANIDYEDTNTVSAGKPNQNKIQKLIKEFNR
jgi:hypothetical protein